MYKLIKAEERHLDQASRLMNTTGYWDVGLKHNARHLSAYEFMRNYIAPLYLPFMTVAVDSTNDNKVLGVIVAGSKADLYSIPENKEVAVDPKVMELFENLAKFEINESYHVSFLAVGKSFRGKGIGTALLSLVEQESKKANFETLSLYTLNYQTSSIKLYLKFGMMITQVITLSKSLPAHYVLYFEKNVQLEKMHDYFDSKSYQKLDLSKLEK